MADTRLNAIEELKWIEEKQSMQRPSIDEFPMETISVKERVLRKTTENLFVPLGLIATTACLALGLVNLKEGNVKKQQFYMRGRVFFQGCTLLAMTMGVWLTTKKKQPQPTKSEPDSSLN